MTLLVLVRHGQTEWNRDERFRGRVDLDLSELGIKQAEATARRISQLAIAAIYSSPLKRAWNTAQITARFLGLEAKTLDGLIDVDFGKWHGLSIPEAASKYSTIYAQWLNSPHLVRFPDGEDLTQVRERALVAVNQVLNEHAGQNVVLVSHKVVCKVLILALLGLDNSYFWQIEQGLCAINVFQVRDNFPVLTLLNDTCHLVTAGVAE